MQFLTIACVQSIIICKFVIDQLNQKSVIILTSLKIHYTLSQKRTGCFCACILTSNGRPDHRFSLHMTKYITPAHIDGC